MAGADPAERAWSSEVVGAALSSGLLLWLSSPPVGLWPLAWVALAPAAWVVLRDPTVGAARLAVPLAFLIYLELLLIPALPFGIADGQWGEAPGWLVPGGSPILWVALIVIPAFAGLLWLAGFGLPLGADRQSTRPAPSPFVLIVIPAAGYAALDFVRINADPGGAWGPLFLSQAGEPTAAIAALGGPWLLTLLIAITGYALGLGWSRRSPVAPLAALAAVAAATLAGSILSPGSDGSGRAVTVAAIQPGYDTAEEDREVLRLWEPGTHGAAAVDILEDVTPLMVDAADAGAELIVLPEALSFVDPRDSPLVASALSSRAQALGTPLVAGFFDYGAARSGSLVFGPGGELSAVQPKRKPMWFMGEGAVAAPDPAPVVVGLGADRGAVPIATILGVGTQDPDLARMLADRGAALLASATHDFPGLAHQQRALASIAAEATGTPIVRADWRYGSAIYGRGGGPVADAGTDLARTVLVAEVRPTDGVTPYVRVGDAVGWAALAVWAGSLLAGRRRLLSRA